MKRLALLALRWGPIVALVVLGAIAGGVYGAVKTPSYRAQAYVVFTAEPGEPMAAVSFAQAYGRLVSGGPILDAAATALGSRTGLSTVTAATSPDAPVVEITATGANATRTADVANAVAKALVDHATGRKAATRVSASVLAAAAVPPTPSSPKPPLELAVGTAAGVLLAGLAELTGLGRRTRLKTVDTGHDLVALDRLRQSAHQGRPDATSSDRLTQGGPTIAIAWTADRVEPPKVIGRAVVIHREQP
jgi:capsular polysaccharide biosynthesis protein